MDEVAAVGTLNNHFGAVMTASGQAVATPLAAPAFARGLM